MPGRFHRTTLVLVSLLGCALGGVTFVGFVQGCAQASGELGELPGPGPDAQTSNVNPNDVDGDGYEVSVDCNDNNSAVHPDADEYCDTIDQDCDEVIDEDAVNATVFYADTDGDGFGDPNAPLTSCTTPADHVSNGDDCYDSNADVYPGQIAFFTTDRGDGSFDYDCSTSVDSNHPSGACSFNGSNCTFTEGWKGARPACGASGDVIESCLQICIGICICEASTSSALNECN